MVDVFFIFGIYKLLLIVAGSIGNLLIFIVCMKLKDNTTFMIMRFLSVSDIITLYFWNLNQVADSLFNLDLLNYNLYYCKFLQFSQFTSLQISAWMLVLICFDRYLTISSISWKTKFTKANGGLKVGLAVVVLLAGLNFHCLFTFGHVEYVNGTEIVQCYATDIPSTRIMATWNTVHAFFYSYIPFCMIAVANFLLVISILRKNKVSTATATNAKNRNIFMNITVFSITILFIVLTCPGAIASSYFNVLIQSYSGRVILFSVDSLTFSYHSLSFITLFITNKKFSKELYYLFTCKRIEDRTFNFSTTNPSIQINNSKIN